MICTYEEHEDALREYLEENQEYLVREIDRFSADGGFSALDELIDIVDTNNLMHGWQLDYEEMKQKLGEKKAMTKYTIQSLFMIITECTELADDLRGRRQDWDHAIIEASDILSRTMSLVAFLVDRSKENGYIETDAANTPSTFFENKMRENIHRPFLHGEKRF